LLFFGASTIFADPAVVGKFGSIVGRFNREYFGYLSFAYPFLLIIPLYFLYKNPSFSKRKAEIVLSLALLFTTLLIFQAAIINDALKGAIGKAITDVLFDYVGTVGVWLFISMNFALCATILFDFAIEDLLKKGNKKEPQSKRNESKKNKKETIEEVVQEEKIIQEQTSEKEDIELEIPAGGEWQETTDEIQEAGNEELAEVKSEQLVLEDGASNDGKKIEVLSEVEENKKLLAQIELGKSEKPKNFVLPSLDFLKTPKSSEYEINENEIDKKISDLLQKLSKFKIEGDVVRTYAGPVVTTFEFRPAAHIKVSKILNLQDDLAMALRAKTIRIQAPVPGKDVVGIEIPNKHINTIYLKDILKSEIFQKSTSPLTIALGKDIVGNPFVTDLKKLPHLLIAGTTGSGKSVGINSILISLLYKNSPDTLKFLMIDPKMLEFSIYNDIPHLLTPVITQPKQAIIALSNMVNEMERRYKIMSKTKTKNIEAYNKKAKKEGLEEFAYIIVIIDELADLMMTSGKDVEFYIARLAQMARASGIHLIVATQRPSVDVVTGLIKANLPSRISYKVGQKIDSKVILDSLGAESLLGRGDMLFTPPGISGLIRLHAPYTSEEEIDRVVEFLKAQRPAAYDESFLKESSSVSVAGENSGDEDFDELYEEAREIVRNERKSSISHIQRRLQIGYNRAARIVEQLEAMGVLSAPNSKGQREIL